MESSNPIERLSRANTQRRSVRFTRSRTQRYPENTHLTDTSPTGHLYFRANGHESSCPPDHLVAFDSSNNVRILTCPRNDPYPCLTHFFLAHHVENCRPRGDKFGKIMHIFFEQLLFLNLFVYLNLGVFRVSRRFCVNLSRSLTGSLHCLNCNFEVGHIDNHGMCSFYTLCYILAILNGRTTWSETTHTEDGISSIDTRMDVFHSVMPVYRFNASEFYGNTVNFDLDHGVSDELGKKNFFFLYYLFAFNGLLIVNFYILFSRVL